MKPQLVLLCVTFLGLGLYPAQQNQTLTITISNVKDERGLVLVALYESADDFMKERFMSLKLPSKKGKVTGVFTNVPPGTYAISVLHDTNNDGEINKNALGIPLEGIGFSNNASGKFGPPGFEKATFEQ